MDNSYFPLYVLKSFDIFLQKMNGTHGHGDGKNRVLTENLATEEMVGVSSSARKVHWATPI